MNHLYKKILITELINELTDYIHDMQNKVISTPSMRNSKYQKFSNKIEKKKFKFESINKNIKIPKH